MLCSSSHSSSSSSEAARGSEGTSTATKRNAILNGTALSSVTYTPTGHANEQNFVLFYQQANGDIRKMSYNGSQWWPGEVVTRQAKLGTGLSSIWLMPLELPFIHLFYIDRDNILQEIRGRHGSTEWVNGTLGVARVRAAPSSHVDAGYAEGCRSGDLG